MRTELRKCLESHLAAEYPNGVASAWLVVRETPEATPVVTVLVGLAKGHPPKPPLTAIEAIACPSCGSADGFVHEGEFVCRDCFGFEVTE